VLADRFSLPFCDQSMKTFTKEERLCSKRSLDLLFKNGSSFLLYPYRVSYLFTPDDTGIPVEVVINVSKRRYKKAVDRNLIKRRTREAYRLQKQEELYSFLNKPEQQLLLSLQFVGKQKYDFSFLERKMLGVLKKLRSKLSTDESS
jgi:ribonuclease P protein component